MVKTPRTFDIHALPPTAHLLSPYQPTRIYHILSYIVLYCLTLVIACEAV